MDPKAEPKRGRSRSPRRGAASEPEPYSDAQYAVMGRIVDMITLMPAHARGHEPEDRHVATPRVRSHLQLVAFGKVIHALSKFNYERGAVVTIDRDGLPREMLTEMFGEEDDEGDESSQTEESTIIVPRD